MEQAFDLLKLLIETPSFSKEESNLADQLVAFFNSKSIPCHRKFNNIWAFNKCFDSTKKTILLNSHIDTVKPCSGYTSNPFEYFENDEIIRGLGSNDAGGCVASLIVTFLDFYNQENLKYNLCLLLSAEEEISGQNGVEEALKDLPKPFLGIIGEPTSLDLAVAEKGLLVIDCQVKGQSGHAAREEGENAFYKALNDFNWIKEYKFDRVSELLGETKMTCTIVNCGTAHNITPDSCNYTLDIRTNELYTLHEILEILKNNLIADIQPRSIRLQSSGLPNNHFIFEISKKMGLKTYGSPTLSDQALMNFPTIKFGPGDSKRSHTADEFIYKQQIIDGIEKYKQLIQLIVEN